MGTMVNWYGTGIRNECNFKYMQFPNYYNEYFIHKCWMGRWYAKLYFRSINNNTNFSWINMEPKIFKNKLGVCRSFNNQYATNELLLFLFFLFMETFKRIFWGLLITKYFFVSYYSIFCMKKRKNYIKKFIFLNKITLHKISF